MNAPMTDPTANTLKARLTAQQQAPGAPTAEERIDRLDRLHNAILDYEDRIISAISADFGNRAPAETKLSEIYALLENIAYQRKHLRRWMRPQRRHTPLTAWPARTQLIYQPLGVVGIIAPWNFPVFLALSPLIGALAAGNRAMLKMSELAPATADLIANMIAETFAPEEVTVVTGGPEVAQAFSELPFDHLVFTGSTRIGRKVMAAAAPNLTPVTLELGGKSPAIIHDSYDLDEAARRLTFGKCFNAGQICVAPDYVLCPREKVDAFATTFLAAVKESYPTLADNDDATAIISKDHYQRIEKLVTEAVAQGATAQTPEGHDPGNGKYPMTVLTNVPADTTVMREEIFGPVLPVLPYDTLDDAIAHVNDGPRPLALYYFDNDSARADKVLRQTHSGGACINDTLSHVTADDLPFGGIGESGMGHYHGHEGFKTFSKAKGVVRKGRIDATRFVAPPWGNAMFKRLMAFQRWRFRRRR